CAHRVPSARPDGLGAAVAGSVPWPVAAAVLLVGLVAALAAGRADGVAWWAEPAVAVAVLGVTVAVVVRCTRRLGGVTGDVLGACVELSLLAALAVLSIAA